MTDAAAMVDAARQLTHNRSRRLFANPAPGVILKPKPRRARHGVRHRARWPVRARVPTVTLSAEHYNMIAGMLKQNVPVKLRVNRTNEVL